MTPCPKCQSTDISGLIAPFWAELADDWETAKSLRELVASETELGPERLCNNCEHEFSAD